MATTKPVLTISVPAGEDLSAFQFMAVTMETDGKVDAHDAATDVPLGVLQNNPDAEDKAAQVMMIGITKVEFGETVVVGDLIRFDTNSKAYIFAVDTDVTAYCAGVCLEGGAAGEIGMAAINCCNPFRGEE